MPEHYGEESSPEPEPAPTKRASVKMTDKQKADLSKHMQKMQKGGMSASEAKSHRMKMMSRMRKGMTVNKAHKDIMK
jgi:hypothetical protein